MIKLFSKRILAISCLALTTAAHPLTPATPIHTTPKLDDRCTFVLWHRQQDAASYIQLNTILDHANDITIDIASQRLASSYNSYTRIDEEHAFAVTGLLDDSSLTISQFGQEELAFEAGTLRWTSRDAYGKEDSSAIVWCNDSVWEGNGRRRVSLGLRVVRNPLVKLTSDRRGGWTARSLVRRSPTRKWK
jgi:hypothetical protein